MATLEKIRSKGPLLIVVIGLALLAFILGDLNQGLDGFSSRNSVGEINGEEIKIEEFNLAVERRSQALRIQLGQQQLSEEMQESVRQDTWESMVIERVMNEQYEALGIAVSPKELSDLLIGENIHPAIQGIPAFSNPQTGMFDKDTWLQYVATLRLDSKDPNVIAANVDGRNFWFFLENYVKNARLEEKYNTLLSKALSSNSIDAQYAFNAAQRTVNIAVARQDFSTIPDSLIAVSDSELKAEYDKKKIRFEQPASRDAKYIVFPVTPSENDIQTASSYVDSHKEDFSTIAPDEVAGLLLDIQSDIAYTGRAVKEAFIDSDFKDFALAGANGDVSPMITKNNVFKMARIMNNNVYTPDSIRVRQIQIMQATPEQTATLTDSLMTAINGGADFAALANKYSANGSQNGGEIGWITEDALYQQNLGIWVEQLFGGSSNLVRLDSPVGGGVQIFQIQERTKPVRKIQLAVLQRTAEASSLTSNSVFNNATRFITENNSLAKFEKAAADQKLEISNADGVQENDPRFANLPDTRKTVQWLFEAEAGDVALEVYQSGNDFLAVALSKENEEGFVSMDKIEATLKQNIIREKKAAQITEELTKKLAANNSLAALGLPVDSLTAVSFSQPSIALGYEPRLVAAASASKINTVSAPLTGLRGVFVFQVTGEQTNPNSTPIEMQQMMLNQQNAQLAGAAFNVLRKAAEIEDNRSKFF
jgi:peptidyl-prolyl cis-trans isomerase D